jgi:lipopolysaccharide assembly protein A
MQILVIIALVLVVVAIILMLQNLGTISVSIFLWNIHSSLAMVMLVALAVGVLISLLLLVPGSIRNKMAASGQNKKLAALEDERNQYQKKSEEAEKEVATLEEQLASFSAALENQQQNEGSSTPQKSIK